MMQKFADNIIIRNTLLVYLLYMPSGIMILVKK